MHHRGESRSDVRTIPLEAHYWRAVMSHVVPLNRADRQASRRFNGRAPSIGAKGPARLVLARWDEHQSKVIDAPNLPWVVTIDGVAQDGSG